MKTERGVNETHAIAEAKPEYNSHLLSPDVSLNTTHLLPRSGEIRGFEPAPDDCAEVACLIGQLAEKPFELRNTLNQAQFHCQPDFRAGHFNR